MTLKNYMLGFALSALLTVLAFSLVEWHVTSGSTLGLLLVLLALIQLGVQSAFFLHLGVDDPDKSKLTVYLFALLIVVIVVVGSLWMPPS